MPELPRSVRLREVGPRDGFQNEPETIETADKIRLIDLLSATGLKRLEVTSFVRPDVIPQLADAEQVLAGVERRDGVAFSVLIPNERGLERALEQRDRFDEISVFLSASETHNRKNVNRSIEDSLAGLERTLATAGEAGLRCEGVIATSFGCPYEGEVPPERVFEIAERLAAAGCAEVGFGDTTGMANPRQVREFFAAARERLTGCRADRPLPQHPRPGPRQRARRARGGRRVIRGQLRRARRLPGPPGLDRQRLQRGRGLDAARDGSRDRHRPAAADRGFAGRPGGARAAARRPRSPRRARRLARRPVRIGCRRWSGDFPEALEAALAGGPQRHHDKTAEQGKLPVRARVERLVDPGSLSEEGLLANWDEEGLGADGVVTGLATIDGRPVALMANDPTVKAGSWGPKTVEKILRVQERALANQVPMVYLVDSAGARITDQVQMFPGRRGAGRIFHNEVRLSGQVPQICLLFGPSAAGGAYIPAFCDVVVMREGNASMYLGSPRMAEMVIGETVTLEEMGGAKMHTGISGCGHFLVKSDEEAIDLAQPLPLLHAGQLARGGADGPAGGSGLRRLDRRDRPRRREPPLRHAAR